ncbi:MAG: response regulator [Spirochaetia bacterium]|nr:response regulator [Spirochaetia bacterium]
MKVLIVDDSMMMRRTLEMLIGGMNVEIVGTAANGRDAVALFSQHKPDLVTLDITMPEMDGLTALKEMIKLNPNAKIIVVSALSSKDTMVQAMNSGAFGYLVKPVDVASLRELMQKVQVTD